METLNTQLSLRQCAINDCMNNYGPEAVEDYKRKLKLRKLNKKKDIKTNVGDPNHSNKRVR